MELLNFESFFGTPSHLLRKIYFGITIIMMCLPQVISAEGLPKESVLPFSLAQKAAALALAKCEESGHKVSVAIVDRGGNLTVLFRGDGAGPHTTDSSFRKAYTSATLRSSTAQMAKLIAKVPLIEGIRDMNEKILILGGGLPIQIEGEVVGGIGVGGAPGADLDEICALAGLKSIEIMN